MSNAAQTPYVATGVLCSAVANKNASSAITPRMKSRVTGRQTSSSPLPRHASFPNIRPGRGGCSSTQHTHPYRLSPRRSAALSSPCNKQEHVQQNKAKREVGYQRQRAAPQNRAVNNRRSQHWRSGHAAARKRPQAHIQPADTLRREMSPPAPTHRHGRYAATTSRSRDAIIAMSPDVTMSRRLRMTPPAVIAATLSSFRDTRIRCYADRHRMPSHFSCERAADAPAIATIFFLIFRRFRC